MIYSHRTAWHQKEDYENANKLKNMLHDVKYALVSN